MKKDVDWNDDGSYDSYKNKPDVWLDGFTMLHICVMESSIKVMEYLLTLPKIDVNVGDRHMMTPVYYAAYLGWYEVVIMIQFTR